MYKEILAINLKDRHEFMSEINDLLDCKWEILSTSCDGSYKAVLGLKK